MFSQKVSQSHSDFYAPLCITKKALNPFLNHRVTFGSDTTKSFSTEQIIKTLLEKIGEDECLKDRCKISFSGSYLLHLLVKPSHYNDIDLKLDLVARAGENLTELVFRMEKVATKAFSSLLQIASPIEHLSELNIRPKSRF